MRHLKSVSVRRAQMDGDDGPTDEEVQDFLTLFLFRWVVVLFAAKG